MFAFDIPVLEPIGSANLQSGDRWNEFEMKKKEKIGFGLTWITDDSSSRLYYLYSSFESVATVSSFFVELPEGSSLWRFTFVDQSRRKFDADRLNRRSILQDTVYPERIVSLLVQDRTRRKGRTDRGIEVGLEGCTSSAAIATASIPPSLVVFRAAISHTLSLPSSSVQSIFCNSIHWLNERTKMMSAQVRE